MGDIKFDEIDAFLQKLKLFIKKFITS